MYSTFVTILAIAALAAYFTGSIRARQITEGQISNLHSRPPYHGMKMVLVCIGPALLLVILCAIFCSSLYDFLVFSNFENALVQLSIPQLDAFMSDVRAVSVGDKIGFPSELKDGAAAYYSGLVYKGYIATLTGMAVLVIAGFVFSLKTISQDARPRDTIEKAIKLALLLSSGIAVLTTIGIVFSLLFETIRFFAKVNLFDFLFGLHWSPQSAFEGADGENSSADFSLVFGAIPLFAGTFLITTIAMFVAAPIGLMAAIYLSDYASARVRAVGKPLLEILAGIPTVVYGFFAALTVAPAIRGFGEGLGLSVASESALAAGLVMGIMIIPFVSSLSDDVINAVPQSLRDGAAALGSTKSETIRQVVIPAALPGIVSAILLGISRAVGETMIVVMAAGLAANLTINPLEAVTTVTVQIVTLLVGDQEFDSAKTLAAFALGLVLFVLTLILNVIALFVVRKYQEQYD